MLGGNNAYSDYSFDDDDFLMDAEELRHKKLRKKIIIISTIIVVLMLFIILTVVACTMDNPKYMYDLVERNDFSQDYTNKDVINQYYPN